MKILLASTNQGKLREIQAFFDSRSIKVELVPLSVFESIPRVVEDERTFMGNAHKKALAYSQFAKMNTLADDSGLVVEALGGDPGVRSSRFAGENSTDEDNNKLLLEKLRDIPPKQRKAKFVCSLVLIRLDGKVFKAKGETSGEILTKPRGMNGFGYDPLFYIPKLGKTMAELSLDEKIRISHRTRALEDLLGSDPMGA